MEATAHLCAYLMERFALDVTCVNGHREWAKTVYGRYITACPGWASGGWRDSFFAALNEMAYGVSFASTVNDMVAMELLLANHDEGREWLPKG